MTLRIAKADLEKLCTRINTTLGAPKFYWESGRVNKTAIGHHTLSSAYGGYSLHRIVNESGGAVDIFLCGHVQAGILYKMMQAYLQGVLDGKDRAIKSLQPTNQQDPQNGPTQENRPYHL